MKTDEKIINALKEVDRLTTKDLIERIGSPQKTIRYNLTQLIKKNRIVEIPNLLDTRQKIYILVK